MISILIIAMSLSLFSHSAESAVIYGIVKRPPKEATIVKKVNRYRNNAESGSNFKKEDCQCSPRLYAVVSLISNDLVHVESLKDTLMMSQKSKAFEPSVLAITVHSTVSFPNLDKFYHNVFSYSKTKKFDLGKYPQNETKYVTFDKPGLVKVFCEIHYSMRAYVHILETPYIAVTNETGKFQISDVPHGSYELRVWQEGQSDIITSTEISTDSVWLEIE